MFDAINASASGLSTYRSWLDVIADNVANVNDETTTSGNVFRTHYLQVAENQDGSGVHVASTSTQAENGIVVNAPDDPLADSAGNVRRADVNISDQMGDMIMAQRAFQANASMVDQAKDAYQAAINIGKGI
jgi:flagellar basal-body rod protein FlgC